MEALGRKLREAREARNVSLEQVARDTHISRQHLEALEEENFEAIPGETYVVGFLRNYAEYLSLDADEIVSLYRNIQIQEQPLPMEELLQPRGRRPSGRLLLLLGVAVVLLGGGAFGLYRLLSSRGPRPEETERPAVPVAAAAPGESGEYRFEEEAVTRWFAEQESIRLSLDGEEHQLRIAGVDRGLTLRVPGGTVDLSVGQDRMLDLDADGRADLRVLLNDVDVTASARRANVGLYKITRGFGEAPTAAGTETAPPAAEAAAAGAAAPAPPAGAIPEAPTAPTTSAEPAAEEPPEGAGAPPPLPAGTPLQTAASPQPFRVSISFRGYCLLRYLVDKDIREERFFHRGESFSLDANNEITLWLSNAGAVRLMVGGREVEVGRAGAVAARQIRWSRDEASGQYTLQVLAVD